ncbi:DUF4214 domain-containing protein [Noviherbaspirillum sp. CPCC 100848]|uniref:DUF4214 domain-containing protein n=1 Tax=Noviherbaspirillum album TaxID=3080276 RepID=A0ABU6J3S5_9BURK|nr:DUF4214 domain-containing protein [Noviherbaspirillum sp. CPCC 100848]MEC4718283.1 DUF4214 domain-containing protein [Noviherbaspirillum sp. CPCC 100848]
MRKSTLALMVAVLTSCGGADHGTSNTSVQLGTVERMMAPLSAPSTSFESQVYRLYKAAFNREPDPAGHAYWVGLMHNGMSLYDVAWNFIASEEFKQRYGSGLTTAQYINQLYANVLDRLPDREGFTYWFSILSNRILDHHQVLVQFSESAENVVNTSRPWREVSSVAFPYIGTVLGTALLRRPDGTNLVVVNGPSADISLEWYFTCKQAPFVALGINSAGVLTNATNALGATSTALLSREMIVADFNSDGLDDFFSGNSGCHEWKILNTPIGEPNSLFLTSGGLITNATPTISAFSSYTHSVAAAVTGYSANVDVIVGSNGGDILHPYILRGDGKGGFVRDPAALVSDLEKFTAVLLEDVNGDGKADLITGTQEQSAVAGHVYLNNGQGKFNSPALPLPVGINGARNNLVQDIVATDLNGDGKKDLLLSTTQKAPIFYGNGKVQVLIGNGDGTFVDKTAIYFPTANNNRAWTQFLHLADLDQDGKLDLVLQTDMVQDADIVAYRFTGSAFEPISRDLMPRQVNSLLPVLSQGKLTLLSIYTNGGNLQAKAFQLK